MYGMFIIQTMDVKQIVQCSESMHGRNVMRMLDRPHVVDRPGMHVGKQTMPVKQAMYVGSAMRVEQLRHGLSQQRLLYWLCRLDLRWDIIQSMHVIQPMHVRQPMCMSDKLRMLSKVLKVDNRCK